MRWLGRPVPLLKRDRIGAQDKHFLRRLARAYLALFWTIWSIPGRTGCRRTILNWRYALRSRNEPPQPTYRAVDDPRRWLRWISAYLTVADFVARCTQTMATLDRLERYEGHFLNWYNTSTLELLLPRAMFRPSASAETFGQSVGLRPGEAAGIFAPRAAARATCRSTRDRRYLGNSARGNRAGPRFGDAGPSAAEALSRQG